MKPKIALITLAFLLFSMAGVALIAHPASPQSAVQEQERPVVVPSTPRRQDPNRDRRNPDPNRAPLRGNYVIPEGTAIPVRLGENLNSKNNESGDSFEAILDSDLFDERGRLVAPQGSRVEGRLIEVKDSGKVKGRARMRMELTRLYVQDDPQTLVTDTIEFRAEGSGGDDAKKVGIAAGIGAIIGAIAGGGKGAAIGAAIGGGAGGATVLLTKGDHIDLRKERLLSFRLDRPVDVLVR
ncbi:MAG TPA: hypothetical protein VLV83_00185 [Acidobacteriota bacterium]|nr:hypothetical protein [Acidobacteriota bacterium]